jgi:rod shape-determining protein MreC
MKWATGRLYKNRKLFLIIAGLVVPLLLFALQHDQKTIVARPIQEVFYTPFWSISNKLTALMSVHSTNVALKAENVRLKFERMSLEQNRLEVQRFKAMLGLLPRPEYKLIPADVIAYEQGRRWSSAMIRASEQIDQFLPVVDQSGLIGKIAGSTGNVATVSLLIGPNCRVAARDNQTRTLGIVKWSGGRTLILDGVAIENDVFRGDTIISSGMGGVFPEGLAVGVVAIVDTIPTEVFKQIVVEPFVDFGALDNVMVMKPLGSSFGY